MDEAHREMEEIFEANFCSLHVRVTNRAALSLYRDRMNYIIEKIEEKYYADGEDAYDMKKTF